MCIYMEWFVYNYFMFCYIFEETITLPKYEMLDDSYQSKITVNIWPSGLTQKGQYWKLKRYGTRTFFLRFWLNLDDQVDFFKVLSAAMNEQRNRVKNTRLISTLQNFVKWRLAKIRSVSDGRGWQNHKE